MLAMISQLWPIRLYLTFGWSFSRNSTRSTVFHGWSAGGCQPVNQSRLTPPPSRADLSSRDAHVGHDRCVGARPGHHARRRVTASRSSADRLNMIEAPRLGGRCCILADHRSRHPRSGRQILARSDENSPPVPPHLRGRSIDSAAGSLEPLLELAARDAAAGLPDAPWPPHFDKQAGEPPG
jgi:hypothetical protein